MFNRNCIMTQEGGHVDFAHPLQSRNDFHSSKKLNVLYFFSITHPFDKFKDNFWFFFFIWANVDYTQLHIPRVRCGSVEVAWSRERPKVSSFWLQNRSVKARTTLKKRWCKETEPLLHWLVYKQTILRMCDFSVYHKALKGSDDTKLWNYEVSICYCSIELQQYYIWNFFFSYLLRFKIDLWEHFANKYDCFPSR